MNLKISQLTAVNLLSTTDILPVVNDGTTKKATIQQVNQFSIDYANGNFVPLSGGTMTGKLIAAADETSSKLNIGSSLGSGAPTTTVDGDVWITNQNRLAYKSSGSVINLAGLSQQNIFSQPQSIGSTSNAAAVLTVNNTGSREAATFTAQGTSPAVRITQNGTGNALIIEDSTNPDATPFIVDSLGSAGIGLSSLTNVDAKLTVVGNISSTGIIYASGGNSNNWNESYTLVQSNSAKEWASAITTTYNELTALKANNSLIPGQTYIISDYQTKWWRQSIDNSIVMTSPVIEPLLVTATSNNGIHAIAKSALYPQDVITYDIDVVWSDFEIYDQVNSNTIIPQSKGWIYRRHDTNKNISMPTDWRHITVPCYRLNTSTVTAWSSATTYAKGNIVKHDGFLYSSLIANNTNITPINNDSNTNWRRMTGFKETEAYLPWRYANDPAFPPSPTYWYHRFPIKNPGVASGNLELYYNLLTYIEQPVFTDSLVSQGSFDYSTNYDIYVEDGCYGNIFASDGNNNIELHTGCNFNIFGGMSVTEVGEYATRNILYNSFAVGIKTSSSEIIMFGCTSTYFADYVGRMTVINCYDFQIGPDSGNMYCYTCQLTKLGYGYVNNSFIGGSIDLDGTSCSDFSGNYFTLPVYSLFIFPGSNLANRDFSTATHVYAAYPKTITRNSSLGLPILTYLNASNVPQYVSVTA